MGELVGNRYSVGRLLGSGAFGQTHLGTDVHTHEQVAIKFESAMQRCPRLRFESAVYKYLEGGCSGIPKARWCGLTGQRYALVLDLLGDNLETLLQRCDGKFSLKTVLMLANQMLKIIEYVHSKSYLHRDIKPDNFMMGRGRRANQVFMIDFGLAKKYRDTDTYVHKPYRDGHHLVGTIRYASINSHNGLEITRRDDLESLGYVLVYFLRGSLPWQGVAAPSAAAYIREVGKIKVSTSIEELCRGFPSEFKSYFRCIRGLRFDEAPDYAFLKKLFRDVFARKGYKYDYVFDWNR